MSVEFEKIHPALEELVNTIMHRDLVHRYDDRNSDHLRNIFVNEWHALPNDSERNSFLPIIDFMELPAVSKLQELHVPDREFYAAVEDARLRITEEVEDFLAGMRQDLFNLYCQYYDDELIDDDDGRAEFLSRADTVFTTGDMPNGPVLHYSTLFRPAVFLPLSSKDFPYSNEHPYLDHPWSVYLGRLSVNEKQVAAMRKIRASHYLKRNAPFTLLERRTGWRCELALLQQ
ncbi:hypothetical protein CALCODRAFT_520571 [Calocera cornea HHB12733]|uniref:Uncharacterized protein n=1 Tax=Calocera cornea HHB12733 TaxID=1353952 RepID=A0A165DEW7_9BASI|nr:hypothetical protein CALCODRAFT_520571 [Calocera cornea HHB12733]